MFSAFFILEFPKNTSALMLQPTFRKRHIKNQVFGFLTNQISSSRASFYSILPPPSTKNKQKKSFLDSC